MSMDMTEFEVTGGRLLELLEQTGPGASLSWLVVVVDNWAQDYDRAEKLDSDDGCNKMHVLGLALCLHQPCHHDVGSKLGRQGRRDAARKGALARIFRPKNILTIGA
jgi:hypothetical protein